MIWKSKKLLALLCCFVCSLLVGSSILSTEVKAINLDIPVDFIGVDTQPDFSIYFNNAWSVYYGRNDQFTTGINQTIWIQALRVRTSSSWGFSSTNGDLFELSINVSNYTRSGTNLDTLQNSVKACSSYAIIDYKTYELSDQSATINIIFSPTQRNTTWTNTFTFFKDSPSNSCGSGVWYLWGDSSFSINYFAQYRIKQNSDQQAVINAINSQSQNLQNIVNEQRSTTNAINNNTNAVNNINEQQTQAGQQAQQDGNNASSNSQQQAHQGGQTLLQGFSSFVGALTSASASDCVINGNIGDFKMGDMDLCQLSPPPAFQAISSIMVIGFVVPLSIATIRKFIGMFRSFQNG